MKGEGMPSGNAHMYRQLNGRRLLTGMVLAILTLGLIVIDLGMGSSGIGPGEVVDALLGGPDGDTANTAILWSIRLPMTLTCVFVGGSLSLAGLQIQTITNNALASPYTLGITASASFGAAIAITLGLSVAGYLWIGTALLALVFALAVSLLIFYLGRLKGMSTSTLILSGIIMNFLLSGVAAVPAIPCLPGDRADHFRVDLREPATFVVDERRRKWLFIGNGCGAPVRLVLASHRTDDG